MVSKFLKKGLIGLAVVAGVGFLLFGTAAPHYVKTAFTKVREGARASVPFEYDIDKAHQEVAALEPAIQEGIETLARAEIEAEHLQKEIVATRDDLNYEGKEIVALREHLQSGDTQLTGGISYPADEVKKELSARFDRYNTIKGILAAKESTLQVCQKNVVAARQHLTALQNAKKDLATRIEGIQAKLNQLKANRASNEYNFDDTAVGRAKESVNDLEKRLEEMARVDELKGKYAERGISIVIEPRRDIVKEIDAEFGLKPKGSDRASADKNL